MICMGKNLELMKMRTLLWWVMRLFRFELPGVVHEGWRGMIQDWSMIHVNPLLVRMSISGPRNEDSPRL
jgi:hypothetical protein